MIFIKENFSIFQSLVEKARKSCDFTLDKRAFDSSDMIMKNFRIPENIYKQFSTVCKKQFPYLCIQDIITQLIFDFVERYSEESN